MRRGLQGFCVWFCCPNNFSTDLKGRAKFWSMFASGRLQPVSLPPINNGSIIHNERLILFISPPFVASYLSLWSARSNTDSDLQKWYKHTQSLPDAVC